MDLPEETTRPCNATPSSRGPAISETFCTVQSRRETAAEDDKLRRVSPMRARALEPVPVHLSVCGMSHEHSTRGCWDMLGHRHPPPSCPGPNTPRVDGS